MKTSELKDAMLDHAVAKCLGHEVVENYGSCIRIYLTDPKQAGYTLTFCPSTHWAHGGPIVEREKIDLNYFPDGSYENGGAWMATLTKGPAVSEEVGPTPLIAAMRCYVASVMGEEVEVPNELA